MKTKKEFPYLSRKFPILLLNIRIIVVKPRVWLFVSAVINAQSY